MKKILFIFCLSAVAGGNVFSQILVPFTNRYSVTQRGGLVLVGNTIVTCNGGAGCGTAQNENPPAGTSADNDFNSAYIDIDADGSTFSSSSATMSLASCSNVTFAGLYWSADIDHLMGNYALRSQVKIKQPGAGSYTTLTADTFYDFNVNYEFYSCFKNVTSIVQAAGNGVYTIANVLADVGNSNQWGGWSLVIAYRNDLQQEQNISIYDGYASVFDQSSAVTISINGFYTPPAGAVNFELGEVAYDGDRGSTGDSLKFKGAGSFVAVSDALHPLDDIFNSTVAANGVLNAGRTPSYKNTLGFDANIFQPNNAAKNYLTNGATSAQVKVTTGGEQIFLQVITTSIDTYEPDLQVKKAVTDVNGGTISTGDTLQYTITVINNGSDTSVATTIKDTLPFNADYVPGSMQISAGPNSGVKTDAAGDDQAELTSTANYDILTVRLGVNGNAVSGGRIPHTGANDSTTFKFRMRITDDCTKLLCNPTISNRANISYSGNISGTLQNDYSNPNLLDGFGCPMIGNTSTSVTVPVSCTPPPDSSIGGCTPIVFNSVPGIRPGYSYYDASWASVVQANTYGTYWAIRFIKGSSCRDTMKYTTYKLLASVSDAGPDQSWCNVATTNLAGSTPASGTGTWTMKSGPNAPSFTSVNSPTSPVTGMTTGTYVFRWTISTGCDSTSDTVRVFNYALPTTSNAGADQNLCNVVTATLAGNNPAAGSGLWSVVSGPNTPTITTPSNRNSTVTGMIAGVYTLRWTITNGVCAASTDDVQITIYATPTASNAGVDQNLCNVTTTNLAGNTPANGSGNWTQISGPNAPTITTPSSATSSITGMTTGVYVFRWTISNGVCASSADDIQITIYAPPTASNAGPDQGLCNVTSTTMAANTPAIGAGTWNRISGPNVPTVTTPSSPTTTITGMITGVYVYRWTISNGVCATSADDIQITISALPSASNAGPDQNLCNVAAATLAGNIPGVGTGSWSVISGPNVPTVTTPSSPTSTVTGMIPGTYDLRWTISNGACAPTTDDVLITIYALPTVSDAGPDQSLCNVTSTTLAGNTPAVGTGAWSLVSGPNAPTITAPASANTTITGMIAGVYVFKWTITSGVCAVSTDNIQVTIYALPTVANSGPDQSLCNVNNTTLAGNIAGVGTGSWSVISGPNAPTITTPSSATSTVTGMIPGMYVLRWTISNGVCAASTSDVQIAIYALPTVSNAGPDQNLCNVTGTTFAGNTAVVGSGNWSLISGPNAPSITTSSSPISTITGMIPGVYVFRWTISNGACTPSTDDVQITIYALPTVAAAGADQNLCNVTTTTLSGNNPVDGTGSWSLISGPNAPSITAPASSNTSVTGMIAGVYVFRWTISNGVCTASTDDIQVTIYALPTVSNAGPDQNLCNVTGTTLAGNNAVVGSGTWTFISGPVTPVITTPSSPTSTVTGMDTGVYVFQWTISNGVCASSSNDVQITNYALPTVSNAGPDQGLCNVNNTTLAANNPVLGTGSWSLIGGPNSPTITSSSNPATTVTGMITGVYTFRWSITNGVCAPSTDDIQVTIYALPTPANAGPDQNLCNVTGITLAGNNPAIGTGLWSLTSGPNVPVITTPSSPNSTVTGMIPGVYIFQWAITSGVCASSTNDVQITNYDLPTVSDAGPDQGLCNVNTATLAGNVAVFGSGVWSLISGPNLPTITTPSSPGSTITGMITGVYKFRWTITNGVCASSTDDVQITIYALPTVSNAGPDQNLCNVTGVTLAGNNVVVGSGLWSLISGPNVPVITTPSSPSSTVTAMITGIYVFRWTVSNGTCTPSTDDIQITNYDLPTVSDAGPDQDVCDLDSAIMAGNSAVFGIGTWTFVSGPNTPVITNPSDTNTSITGMIPGVYIFRWTIINGVCASSIDNVTISVYALPTVATVGPNQDLCNVTTTTLTGNAAIVGSGLWTVALGPNTPTITNPSDSVTMVTGMIFGSYIFRWTISNGSCLPTFSDVAVTIYNQPGSIDAGLDQSLCNIDSAVMAGNVPGIGTGTWTQISGPNTPVITNVNDPVSSITGMVIGTYEFGWTITNGVCSTPTDTVQVIIYDLPTTSNAGAQQDLCDAVNTFLEGNIPAVGTGIWTFISGPNVPAITDSSLYNTEVTGLIPGVYVFKWTITSGPCATSDSSMTINNFAGSLITDGGPDQSLCNIDSAIMAGNIPAIGTGDWIQLSGPVLATITNPNDPATSITGMIAGTYQFGWSISNGVCISPVDTVQVDIYDLPTVADAGPDQNLCNIDSAVMAANTALTGAGNWTLVSGPNIPVIADTTNESTIINGMVAGTYLFNWTISNGVCSPTSDTVQITIYDLPTVAIAGIDQSLCNVDSSVMTANTPGIGVGAWTFQSGPYVPGITDPSDPVTSFTGMTPGIYVSTWSISNGVCATSVDSVQVTIYSLPTVAIAGPDQNLCNQSATALAGNFAGTGTGNWLYLSGPNVPVVAVPSIPNTPVSGLVAGSYEFIWTITNGVCAVDEDTVQVNVYDLPTIADAGLDQKICADTMFMLSANTPWSGTASWTLVSGPNIPTITDVTDPSTNVTGVIPGTYVFDWSISSGSCLTTHDTIEITVYQYPVLVDAGPDQSLCNVNSISLNGNSPSGSSAVGTWTLEAAPNVPLINSPGSPATSVSNVVEGNYIFSWSIVNGTCPTIGDTVQIAVYNLPTIADAGLDQSLCNTTAMTLAGSNVVSGTGIWTLLSGPNFPSITSPGSGSSAVTGMVPGVYQFHWSISNGTCSVSDDTVQVSIFNIPLSANAGSDQILCNVNAVAMSATSPAAGVGTWSFLSGPNIPVFTLPNDSATSITGLTAGSYIFGWTVNNGVCSTPTDPVTITIYDLPTVAAAGSDQALCNSTIAMLNGNLATTGASLWTLSSGPNIPTINSPGSGSSAVTGLIEGMYTFTWTISNGVCAISEDSVQISVYDLPAAADAGPDQSLCNTGSATISAQSATAGIGYWTLVSGPNTPIITDTLSANTTVTGIIAGTYKFAWTITNGVCAMTSDTVQVDLYDLPTVADAGFSQALCNAGNATLTGNVPALGTGVWAQWSGPNMSSITSPNNPVTTITGMIPGTYVFSWSVSNGTCAVSTDTLQIVLDGILTPAVAGADQELCNNTFTVATTSLGGNVPAIGTGAWTLVSGPTFPLILAPGSPSTQVTGLVDGIYIFRWTIVNGSCTPSTDDVQITVYTLPASSNAGIDQVMCLMDSTYLSGDTSATGIGTWALISGPNTPTITSPNNPYTSVTGMVPGLYTFGWTFTNGICSSPTDSMQVLIYDMPTISNAGPDQDLCHDSVVTLAGITPLAGIGTWSLVSGPSLPVFNDMHDPRTNILNLVSGTYNLRWTITSGTCGSTADDVSITIYDLPSQAVAGSDQVICGDTSVLLASTQPNIGQGTWSVISGPGIPTISCPNCPTTFVTGLATGTYTMRWTVSNGVCSSVTDDVQITRIDMPTSASAGPDQVLCNSDSIMITGNQPVIGIGIWSMISGPVGAVIDHPDSASTSVTDMTPGNYIFRWSINNGVCAASDDIQVTINPAPNIMLNSHKFHICAWEDVQLIAGGAISYSWTPSTNLDDATIYNPIANPKNTTVYYVTGTDLNGCSSTDSVVVELCDTLIIPNGFSPNGDGTNDFFEIRVIENYPNNALHIYNRWGNLIYETTKYHNQWDGVANVNGIIFGDGKVPVGTYYYVFEPGPGELPRSGFLVIRY